MFVLAVFSLLFAYLSWSLIHFANNYIEAKKIGLHILICPVNPANPLWMFSKDVLGPILLRLPFGLGEWAGRAEIGWTFKERYTVHAKYGEAFIIVSPGENEVILANPAAADDVTRRRNDFIKNPAMYGMLDIYGPNLDTVNGKVWDRHRKITVPPFNEQNSALVWREAGEQADQMLAIWRSKAEVTSTQSDVHAVALNVLCGAGFGVHSSFVDTRLPPDHSLSAEEYLGYRESLRLLLANIVPLVVLGLLKKVGVPNWIWFGNMRKVAIAYDEFKGYMSELITRERTAIEQGDLSRHNLMSELVRAQEQSKQAAGGDKETATTVGLSEDEVYGNLFIYNLAGHDTTAGALHFAITLLAVYPEWQTWIAEEIDQVRKAESSGLYYYEHTFPQLQRCLALMYETLRLYGPVVMMPRYTGDAAQTLRIGEQQHVIPPKTTVMINFAALHTHPSYWGPDPLAFRPDRWFVPAGENGEASTMLQPVPGVFVPWNLGPRVCPGKKFSQVEFTRIIFGLFADGTRVEVVKQEGETDEDARRRVLDVVKNAKIEVTLKMTDAERISLKWIKR
ncbi:Cytochrome P450 monooxygenase ORF6 [Exophiala dermatitidis]